MQSVQLYIYDLSFGMASQMSLPILGRQIDGIWHTSIVCFNREYFFSSRGIESCTPGMTVIGQPLRKHDLGQSQLDADIFMEYLTTIGNDRFRPGSYDLFHHNCNTFSSEVGHFLTGNFIPSYITNLPSEVLSTPFGGMIQQFISSMEGGPAGGTPISSPASSQMSQHSSAKSSIPNNKQPMIPKNINECDTTKQSSSRNSTIQEDIISLPVIFSKDIIKVQSCMKRLREMLNNSNTDIAARLDCYLTNGINSTEKETEFVEQTLIPCLTTLINVDSEYDTVSTNTRIANMVTPLKHFATNESSLQLLCNINENLIITVTQIFSTVTSIDDKVEIVEMLCNILAKTSGAKYLTSNKQYSINSTNSVCPENMVTTIIVSCLLDQSTKLQNAGTALVLNFAIANCNEEVSFECASALIEMMRQELDYVSTHRSLSAINRLIDRNEQITSLIEATDLNIEELAVQHPKLRDICHKIKKRIAY